MEVLQDNGNTETRNAQDTANKADPKRPLLRLLPKKGAALSVSNHYTDMGNAAYFIERQGQHVRYVATWGQWLIWDGKRWRKDETGYIMELAKDTILSMYAAAGKVKDEQRADYIKHVLRSEQQRALAAMVELVKTEPRIAVHHDRLDGDDMLFNCENGTIDLRTMQLRPHDPADLITKLAPVTYDPKALAPRWMAFLEAIMCGDTDLMQFLSEAIGISLSGDISDEIFIVLHGAQGGNGKSTFLETVRMLLGEYGQSAPSTTFVRKRDRGIENDVARLIGVRFCSASETEEGQHLADSRIKELTGGDTMTARFLHHEYFDFKPKATLFLATNHRPQVRNGDKGLWRRMRLVSFHHSFVANGAEPMDKRIVLEQFKAELSGIFNWALAGWAARQQRGRICFPDSMRTVTDDYRQSMDIIGSFIADNCVKHSKAQVKASELYAAYNEWCLANGERPKDHNLFGEHLVEQLELQRVRKNSGKFYVGIGMRAEYGDLEEEAPAIVSPAPVTPLVPAQATLEQYSAPVQQPAHLQPVATTTTPPTTVFVEMTKEAQKLLDLLPEVAGDGNGIIVSPGQPSVQRGVLHYTVLHQPAITVEIDAKHSKTLSGVQLFNALAALLRVPGRVAYVKGVLAGLEAL